MNSLFMCNQPWCWFVAAIGLLLIGLVVLNGLRHSGPSCCGGGSK